MRISLSLSSLVGRVDEVLLFRRRAVRDADGVLFPLVRSPARGDVLR
jgi:hypothetical protein